MNKKKVVSLIQGDGIGPEVSKAVERIFKAAGVPIDFEIITPHSNHNSKSSNSRLPPLFIESIKRNKVALKGPLATPIGKGIKSLNLEIRKAFDLFANVRPCTTIPGLETMYGKIDLVTIRENTEGEYSGIEHMINKDIAQSVKVITRKGSEKISKFAFEYAIRNKRKLVTVCHKANIMRQTDGLFLKTARCVSDDYKKYVSFNEDRIDTTCMRLISNPKLYDVLLMPNLYGDIVSDLCSGLIGGLGLTSSGNFGKEIAIFEAVHGSAPDIAGKDLANPTALILSSVMMLRHLKMDEKANRIENAVHATLKNPKNWTGDLGGKMKCSEYTNEILKNIK